MDDLETKAFEAAIKFRDVYHKLEEQARMVRNTALHPDYLSSINSPTCVTNCLHFFREAGEILEKYPHPESVQQLVELYLKFEEVRPQAQKNIAEEYKPDNEYFRKMMDLDSQGEFEAAKKEAEAMLK